MKINKLALGFLGAAVLVAGAMILAKKKKHHLSKMLSDVADEGYETAHDILFPGRTNKEKSLRYGPVLPM